MNITQYNETMSLIFADAVVSYPAVVNPKQNTLITTSVVMEYSVDILIPKDGVDTARMKAVMEAVKMDKWGNNVPDFKYQPVKDGDTKVDKLGDQVEGYQNCWYITAKAQEASPPGVIDLNKEPLDSPDAIVGGDRCNVFVNCFAYSKAGNSGVSWGLNTIQLKAKAASPFGGGISKGAAASAFDDVNDTDMGI